MTYCTKCNNQNPSTSKFCSSCGLALTITEFSDNIGIIYDESANKKTNKKKYIIGGIVLLILGSAVLCYYFIFKNKTSLTDRKAQAKDTTNIHPTTMQDIALNKEYNKSNNFRHRNIPQPLVPIVKALDILPTWTEEEDFGGDHMLIGLYVGSIGSKPIKLFIASVDTVSHTVMGYDVVDNKRVNFEGYYTERFRPAPTNQANNIVTVNEWIYNLTLFNPEAININGIFQLELGLTDAHGDAGSGSFISYNGNLYLEIILYDTYVAENR
jgi:hypothetical protein